jgi:hypothetical protein
MVDQKKTRTPKRAPRRTAAPEGAGVAAAKARTRRAKPAAKAADVTASVTLFDAQLPEEMRSAIRSAEAAAPSGTLPLPEQALAPAAKLIEAGAEQTRQALARARSTGEELRQVAAETAQQTALGAFEVNEKVLDALRAQSDAAFECWRAALGAGSMSEAIGVQAAGARKVYETATSHWADVAESARRWLGATVRPMQSAWTGTGR